MKIIKVLKSFAWWIVTVATLAFSVGYALPNLLKKESAKAQKSVVSIWNVDTFEGGKGSRTKFLNEVAKSLEKSGDVIFVVTSKTAEGVKAAFEKGETPDMLSFGVGVEFPKDGLTYCWCMGKYALFSRSGESAEPTCENTVISVGGQNLSLVAAALGGFSGDVKQESSLQAYVRFLNGDFKYLLGTQRDAQRLISRGVDAKAEPLNAYTDLKQYLTIFSEENEHCKRFAESLLCEETQKKLTKIGMLSERYEIYGGETPLCQSIEQGKTEYFLPHSLLEADRKELLRLAQEALAGRKDLKILKNFLKRA